MLCSLLLLLGLGQAGEAISNNRAIEWNHQQDVVYGYKDGMALVMDVFTPSRKSNGAGVIRLMSGGMVSSPNWSHGVTNDRAEVRSLLEAGYVVFAVAHSSYDGIGAATAIWQAHLAREEARNARIAREQATAEADRSRSILRDLNQSLFDQALSDLLAGKGPSSGRIIATVKAGQVRRWDLLQSPRIAAKRNVCQTAETANAAEFWLRGWRFSRAGKASDGA